MFVIIPMSQLFAGCVRFELYVSTQLYGRSRQIFIMTNCIQVFMVHNLFLDLIFTYFLRILKDCDDLRQFSLCIQAFNQEGIL